MFKKGDLAEDQYGVIVKVLAVLPDGRGYRVRPARSVFGEYEVPLDALKKIGS